MESGLYSGNFCPNFTDPSGKNIPLPQEFGGFSPDVWDRRDEIIKPWKSTIEAWRNHNPCSSGWFEDMIMTTYSETEINESLGEAPYSGWVKSNQTLRIPLPKGQNLTINVNDTYFIDGTIELNLSFTIVRKKMRCCKCVDGTYLSKRCNEYQEFPVELKKETVTPRWKEVTLHYQNQRITIGGQVNRPGHKGPALPIP